MSLPDFEAWAMFVKVVRAGSFSRAANELGLSKATVSKAITRLEAKLGSPLLQRTSRHLALTDVGRHALARADRMLIEAEAADHEASEQAAAPRGKVLMTAPVYFGIEHVAPLLPDLFAAYPDVSIDLHLSDTVVDLVGGGYDLAVRIASLADSSLRARRLCAVRGLLVGSPAYFARFGRPAHPSGLGDHRCLVYAQGHDLGRWHFENAAGEVVAVTPRGPLRSNSGEAFLPLLRAGCGVTILPEFMIWRDLAAGTLEPVLADWSVPTLGVNLVMPPGGRRPARVQVVIDALAWHLSKAGWAAHGPQSGPDAFAGPAPTPPPERPV